MSDDNKGCPFCGAIMFAYQGYRDFTYFTCGDPREEFPKSGCGAVVSFRDIATGGDGGLRGQTAFDAFNRRS